MTYDSTLKRIEISSIDTIGMYRCALPIALLFTLKAYSRYNAALPGLAGCLTPSLDQNSVERIPCQ
jgi:hypothetical protein